MKLSVIITCFNEKDTILRAIQEAQSLKIDKEIIIIDNCSTDGSREILKNIDDGSMKIVFQPKNYGFGESVKKGASLAKGEFIYVHYSDLEYDIECVYRMLEIAERESVDVVFGSRFYGKNIYERLQLTKKRPFYLGTLVTTFLINLFYARKFTDIIGTRFYRTASFRKLSVKSSNIAFDFEVVSRLCKTGHRILEVPVLYKPRSSREGKKVRAADIVPALTAIFKVKFLG
jgi:glycosyltransferase involved in cell wall biosynthesis